MITAIIIAINRLYPSAFTPVAFEKSSSKVTAKILLYRKINITTTITESIAQMITSFLVSVSIDIDPNKVLHTSPDTLADVVKTFIRR